MSITFTDFTKAGLTGQIVLLQDYINTSGLLTTPTAQVTSISYTDPNGVINYNIAITTLEQTNILSYIASITFDILTTSFSQAAPVNLSQIEVNVNAIITPSGETVDDIEYDDPNGTINYSAPGISSLQEFFVNQYLSTYSFIDNSIAVFIPDFTQFGNVVTLDINQTANRTLTLPDTTDTIVTLNFPQTLTNKTLTDSTNDVTAKGLFSSNGTNTINVSAAANPSVGQVLTATSATTAVWSNPVPAAVSSSFVAGQSTTNSTYQLINGSTLTLDLPPNSTYVVFYSWQYTYSVTNRSIFAQLVTNTPPSTTAVIVQQQTMNSNNSTSERYPFSGVATVSTVAAVPGFTIFVQVKAQTTGDTASLFNVTLLAWEI